MGIIILLKLIHENKKKWNFHSYCSYKIYSYLLRIVSMRHQARSMGHPVRIKLTNNGPLIQPANHELSR